MIFLKNKLLHLAGFFSLFAISLYLPLFFFIYSPRYHFNQLQEIKRIERIGQDKAVKAVEELYGFFRHENSLTLKEWSKKELQHLKEVRRLFNFLGLFFLFSILFLSLAGKKINISRISLWNGMGLLLLGILLSVHFVFFWKHIFHPLLFENNLWRNTPDDLSYYLMPRSFFKKISLWICFFSLGFHFLLCLFFRIKENLKAGIHARNTRLP